MISPAPPLPAFTTIFKGFSFGDIDVGQQMLDIGVRGIDAMPHAAALRVFKLAALGKSANLRQAIVAADGLGLLAHEFHAVVIGRIVAGGDHDAAVVAAVEGGKVHALGAAYADVIHIDAAVGQTAAHRIGET